MEYGKRVKDGQGGAGAGDRRADGRQKKMQNDEEWMTYIQWDGLTKTAGMKRRGVSSAWAHDYLRDTCIDFNHSVRRRCA